MLESILNARVTFEATLWVVTLAAFVLLALVAGNLHLRIARLERAPRERTQSAYAHLIGRHASEFVGAMETVPRGLLLLSAGCPACQRLVRELEQASPPLSIALAWTRGDPPNWTAMPGSVTVLDHGPAVGSRVGTTVTPFFLGFDSEGFVEKAGPVTSLPSVRQSAGLSHRPHKVHAEVKHGLEQHPNDTVRRAVG
jgi:hypothetical protein